MRKTQELAGATVCAECGFPRGEHSPDCRQWYQPRALTDDYEEGGIGEAAQLECERCRRPMDEKPDGHGGSVASPRRLETGVTP